MEDSLRPEHDLAVVGDADLGAGARLPDGGELDVAIGVHDGDAADLRLAVDLLEVHADGVEEAEDVGAERRAAGVAPPDAGEAELVPHRAQRHPVGHLVHDHLHEARLLALELRLGVPVTDGLSPGECLALEPAGLPNPDHDRAEHVLPDAGRAEHHVGPEFAEVGPLRGRLLGEAEGDPGRHGVGHGDHLLADPGQGQEAQIAVVGVDRIDLVQGLAHDHQVGVRQHCKLGAAGGA